MEGEIVRERLMRDRDVIRAEIHCTPRRTNPVRVPKKLGVGPRLNAFGGGLRRPHDRQPAHHSPGSPLENPGR